VAHELTAQRAGLFSARNRATQTGAAAKGLICPVACTKGREATLALHAVSSGLICAVSSQARGSNALCLRARLKFAIAGINFGALNYHGAGQGSGSLRGRLRRLCVGGFLRQIQRDRWLARLAICKRLRRILGHLLVFNPSCLLRPRIHNGPATVEGNEPRRHPARGKANHDARDHHCGRSSGASLTDTDLEIPCHQVNRFAKATPLSMPIPKPERAVGQRLRPSAQVRDSAKSAGSHLARPQSRPPLQPDPRRHL
jgi:hypothetical protein